MRTQQIVVPYLGQRDYVQGGSLFSALVPYLEEASDITFKVSRVITCNRLELIPLAAGAASNHEYPCSCSWRGSAGLEAIAVRDTPPADPSHRIAYDESLLTGNARVEGKAVSAFRLSRLSFIECLVALNKKLLHAQEYIDRRTPFLFTRLDLVRLPRSVDGVTLKLEHTLAGQHFMSSIVADGEALGRIIFSLKQDR